MKRVGSTRRKRALRCRYVDEKSREVLPESLAEARGAVEALIAAEGGGRDVFVGGFSQGGMVRPRLCKAENERNFAKNK